MNDSVKEISEKLEDMGIEGVYDAYRSLRPWAFRADLWR